MEKIFLNAGAINSGNWFNVNEMIIAVNNLLKNYGINGAACVKLPTKSEFDKGMILVGKIFAGEDEYTFPFFKTGDAAVFLENMGRRETLAKGKHLEILFKFFDLMGLKLRVNIKRREEAGGILCESPLPANKKTH